MKRPLSLGIFLVLSVIAWWSITEDFSASNQLQQTSNKPYVDIFMNAFELTAMNDSGTPSYILHGSHLQQFNGSDDTEIEQPVFHLLQQKTQWEISADSAIFNNKNETIQLNSNVLMQQQNIEPATSIRTQSLLIHTKTQIAQTQAAVNITQGQSRIKSNGMIFNTLTSELELSANVSGVFLPYE